MYLALKGDDISKISAYSDAYWEGNLDDQNSTSDFIYYVGNEVYCNNQAAETAANSGNGYVSRGAKHIDLRYHNVREMVANKQIHVSRVEQVTILLIHLQIL